MNNRCETDDCGALLAPGDRVVQMASGRYFPEQITPTYGDFVSDPEVRQWHAECFKEFDLVRQAPPYKCLRCHRPIQRSEEVYYITVGTKYSLQHVRLAGRGKTMPWIIHARDCELQKVG
jgi:hypothetical protein